jgi:hypothetical protein
MGLLDLSCFYLIYAVTCDNAVEKCYDEKIGLCRSFLKINF